MNIIREIKHEKKYLCPIHDEISETFLIEINNNPIMGIKCLKCIADRLNELLPTVYEVK